MWGWFRKRRPAAPPKPEPADDDNDDDDVEDVATPPLTNELDLHTFQPRDCADLVDEYLRAAVDAGFSSVRIIHGKGTGTLRRIVHGVLDKHPAVASFRLGDERSGSWGATLVELRAQRGDDPV